ncbi:MAG: hypothetical protein Q8R60_15315 [Mycobacteriales bacterium]|nr:hypothetical protein [Mycobacteriales bacterium]
MTWVDTSDEAILTILGAAAVLFLLWTAAVALWQWRQSKVDLIALEEKIQAKRRKKPGYVVEGLTEAELADVTTARIYDRRWLPRRR